MKQRLESQKHDRPKIAGAIVLIGILGLSTSCTDGPVRVGDLSVDECNEDTSPENPTLNTGNVRETNHRLQKAQQIVTEAENRGTGTAVLDIEVVHPDHITADVAVEPGVYQRPDNFFTAGINDLVCHEKPYEFFYRSNGEAFYFGAFAVGVLQQNHISGLAD